MKQTYTSTIRHYRRAAPHPDEVSFQLVEAESDLWITVLRTADGTALRNLARDTLRGAREVISSWLRADPAFGYSLVPVSVPLSAPELVRRMADAARAMHVGPMACVAGAVAGAVAARLAEESAECIVENGGDTMLYSTRERTAALLSDPAAGTSLGILLRPDDFPLSLCASSAFIGHSLSLGNGDLAVARAADPCLADAAATAYCNTLKTSKDTSRAVKKAERDARRTGLEGLFVRCGDRMALWGKMELTPVR